MLGTTVSSNSAMIGIERDKAGTQLLVLILRQVARLHLWRKGGECAGERQHLEKQRFGMHLTGFEQMAQRREGAC